jgi:hypothetical protein
MADGVNYTEPGTGTKIATDDCGTPGHIQLVKLAYSGDGVATLVTADATGVQVNTELPTAAALADNLGNPTTPLIGACLLEWDGTQWVRKAGAIKGPALALAARTAQATAALTKPRGYTGIMLFIRVTVAGTSNLTPFIQATDPVSGSNDTMYNFGNITTTGVFQAMMYPSAGATPVSGSALSPAGTASFPCPEDIVVGIAKGDASSWTYSLGYCWLY